MVYEIESLLKKDDKRNVSDNIKRIQALRGTYSAFTEAPGPNMLMANKPKDNREIHQPDIRFPVEGHPYYMPSAHQEPMASYAGIHAPYPPDFHIAPAFAQIFQRRRRRESRPRRQRTTFTSDQTLKLELEYTRADYISRPRRFELAETLHLSESQIKIWFQNRRAKDKRIEKAHIDHGLRTRPYQSMSGGYNSSTSYPALCGTCTVPIPLSLPQLPWTTTT